MNDIQYILEKIIDHQKKQDEILDSLNKEIMFVINLLADIIRCEDEKT